MKFNISHTALLLLLCAIPVACNKTDVQSEPDTDGKTPITLSVGGIDSSSPETKAVITDGTGHTMKAFDVNSKIFMIMKSEYQAFEGNYSYLNYGGSQNTKYTVTRGEVTANSNDVTFNTDVQKRYWDDAHARSSQLTIWAYAQKGQPWDECTFEEPNTESVTDPLNKYKDYPCNTTKLPDPVWRDKEIYPAIRYWRASNQSDDSQNKTTVQCQDLLFSNNIVDYSSKSGSDWRLKFDPATRHFPSKTDEWTTGVKKTEMKFYHAMSKITIHIKKGSGFETGSFNFTGGGNVALSGFNKKGLFHIGDGQFEYIWKHKPGTTTDEETEANAFRIPSIYKWDTPSTGDGMTLEALVIPNVQGNVEGLLDTHSRFVKDAKTLATDVMMEFIINNNKYQITSGQLYDALHKNGSPVDKATEKTDNGTYIPLEAGKNYVFTFIVSKVKIDDITAKVAEWENVIAEEVPVNNAKVSVTLDDRGTEQKENIYLYRSTHTESTIPEDASSIKAYDWEKGYVKSTSAQYESNKWTTEWYWDDNKSFYHFRALLHTTGNAVSSLTEESNKQYASISSKDATADAYDAVAWGAPFMQNKEGGQNKTFTYSTTKGFDGNGAEAQTPSHQIYHAIGATEDPIKMLLFHMMSGVHFTITTTGSDDSHPDKVELCHNNGGETPTYTRPKVQLVGYYPDGKVWMGNGLVDAAGTKTGTDVNGITCRTITTDQYGQQDYYYSAIPQDLADVKLYITTPDNNQYIVNLKDVKASGTNISSNNISNPYTQADGKYVINRWYPGFKYNYTFKLKKTGIDNITATVVDWETVEVPEEDVKIQ